MREPDGAVTVPYAADLSDTASVISLLPILLLGVCVALFVRREWHRMQAASHARAVDWARRARREAYEDHDGHQHDGECDDDAPQAAPRPRDPSEEPAYQFPGVPAGWSLDRYARDGISQMNLHLAQTARRNGDST